MDSSFLKMSFSEIIVMKEQHFCQACLDIYEFECWSKIIKKPGPTYALTTAPTNPDLDGPLMAGCKIKSKWTFNAAATMLDTSSKPQGRNLHSRANPLLTQDSMCCIKVS